MPFRVFASAAILEAQMGQDAGFAKSAHRAVFNYTPREGYLYVRSRAISSRCNDNFDMFPAEEIEKSYLTFIGKPVFVNHHNEDHRRARGMIIDAALHKDRNPDGSPDTWSEVLMEVDAVRFPRLAKAILAGEVDRTSMGCDVQLSKCSVCGNEATSPLQYCAHIPGKKGKKIYKLDHRTGQKTAQLVFEICSGLSFFENSLLVEAPADPTAFFLGGVEVGPGLEHLTAGVNKTASKTASIEPDFNWPSDGRPTPERVLGRKMRDDAAYASTKAHRLSTEAFRSRKWQDHESASEAHYTAADLNDLIPGQDAVVQDHVERAQWHNNKRNQILDGEDGHTASLSVWDLLKQAATEPLQSAAQHGVENDYVRGFEGREVPDHGTPVAVYRDLSGAPKSGYPARGSWSIKHQNGKGNAGSHVQAHTIGLHITNAEPTFYEGAREHFKNEEKRGVHAFVKGNVHHYSAPHEHPEGEGWRQVSYYPDISHFFLTDSRNKYHGSDEGAFLGGKMWARGNIKEGDDGPVPESKFERPKTGKVWEMIHDAAASGDDLFDWDFVAAASNSWVDDETGLRVTAATNAETDDWHRDHTAHPKNLVDLFNFAVDHNYHKDLPKMENHEAAIHHGMNWYPGMHAVGESLAKSAHPSLKVNAKGEKDDNLLRHRVFGALGVYSEGTDVPMNYHQASLATSKGRPLWSKDTGMDKDEQTHEFGVVKDTDKDSPTKGQMVPGKPKSMEEQAKKVGLLFSPNLKHMHEVVKAAKTSNYSALGMHGGDEPDTKFGIDQIHSGYGKGGRVVIDRHALSAAVGHRIDGVDFNSAGLSKYQKPTKSDPSELAHLHTQYGNDENKHYSFVADAYRVAAQHLSNHHGRQITPEQVQAVTWGTQKHMNDNGIMRQPSLSSKKSSWSGADEDTWKGVVNSKHSWVNDADNESMDRSRSFKDRPNTRNINNWERHLEDRPNIGEPINKHFQDYGPRGHWGKKLAYGETKSPEDVDTLRSENCTVCGNSSAWDGTQCQVCGYVAPPRPFGDPNTDIAQQKDIRKQVLDGNEADPNDPNQQLGQQQGDPSELQDQQDAAAAGEDTQLQTLTCNVCGTGIQPSAPTSESDGEPAYPAEGDVCPVCKKGQLLGSQDGEPGMDEQAAEEGQEGNDNGATQQQLEEDDGDDTENEEFKGKQDDSDDDDQDDGDAFDPKKKADKNQKVSSFAPVWWKPSWWRG